MRHAYCWFCFSSKSHMGIFLDWASGASLGRFVLHGSCRHVLDTGCWKAPAGFNIMCLHSVSASAHSDQLSLLAKLASLGG